MKVKGKSMALSTTKKMLNTLLGGGNCSVLQWAAASVGKSFAMLGSKMCPGALTVSEPMR